MNDTVLRVAEMLGVAANELIGYYEQRAPLEWVDVWVVLGIILVVKWVAVGLIVFGLKKKDDDFVAPGAVLLVFAVVIGGFLVGVEAIEAYKAEKAPKAYAVDQILKHID